MQETEDEYIEKERQKEEAEEQHYSNLAEKKEIKKSERSEFTICRRVEM